MRKTCRWEQRTNHCPGVLARFRRDRQDCVDYLNPFRAGGEFGCELLKLPREVVRHGLKVG